MQRVGSGVVKKRLIGVTAIHEGAAANHEGRPNRAVASATLF
jgi:hypothetical protein